MVEVAVGEQDRLERDPELIERGQQPRSLLTRIDDQAAIGTFATEDVAVLGHRSHGVGVDVHQLFSFADWDFPCSAAEVVFALPFPFPDSSRLASRSRSTFAIFRRWKNLSV